MSKENGVNYIEWIFGRQKSSIEDVDIYDIGLTRAMFIDLLSTASNAALSKPFFRKYKYYIHSDMCYEITEDQQSKVYQAVVHKVDQQAPWVVSYSTKSKIPYHLFPCTTKLYDILYVGRLTFKLHNRVFLNFEQCIRKENQTNTHYKVYVNYNHDTNVDVNSIKQVVNSILCMLKPKCNVN